MFKSPSFLFRRNDDDDDDDDFTFHFRPFQAFQLFLGAGSVWYQGALFGGGMKAKSVWKYHRYG